MADRLIIIILTLGLFFGSDYGLGGYGTCGYGNDYEFFWYWLTDDWFFDINKDGIVNWIDWSILLNECR